MLHSENLEAMELTPENLKSLQRELLDFIRGRLISMPSGFTKSLPQK
jgi:hypothetical protein